VARLHQRFLLLGALGCAGTLGAAPGCTSFGSADVAAAPPEAGSTDGGSTEASPVLGDAAADVGRPCAPPNCLDLEDGRIPNEWAQNGSGSPIVVTAGPSTSGTHALDVTVGADAPTFLVRDLTAFKHVAITANVLIVAEGAGEVDLLGISHMPLAAEDSLYLVHSGDSAEYAIELPTGKVPLGQRFKEYVPIRLEVDLVQSSYVYQVGAGAPQQGKLATTAFPGKKLYVLLGAAWATSITKPWHIRFDDIEVTTF
jgi:hypothetical protein